MLAKVEAVAAVLYVGQGLGYGGFRVPVEGAFSFDFRVPERPEVGFRLAAVFWFPTLSE